MNHKCDTDERVCFYEQEFYVLSNFSAFKLMWKGILFDTSEQAYHWEKFRYPNIQAQLLRCTSAHDASKTAAYLTEYIREDWKEVRVGIMKDILRAKASQHEYVRRKLLETGDRQIVEDSWRDDFWGEGENKDGQNMMGKLWMEIREEIRRRDA